MQSPSAGRVILRIHYTRYPVRNRFIHPTVSVYMAHEHLYEAMACSGSNLQSRSLVRIGLALLSRIKTNNHDRCILSDIALIVLNVLPLPHDSDEPLAYGLQVYYYLTPGLPVATASAVCFKPLIDNFLNAWRRYKKARSPDVSSATEEGELETIGRRRQNHNKRGLVGIATTDLNNSDAWLVTRESGEETVVQNSGTTSTTSSKTIGDKDKA